MSTLSNKSDQEIMMMLDDYGIKHGPIVASTRSLYERKLKEAMVPGKEKKTEKFKSEMVTPSPDKTYYREEEEEVTYVTYRTPLRNDMGERSAYMRPKADFTESRDFVDTKPYSRSRVEYSGTDYEEKTYSRPRGEYSGRDYVEEPRVYDSPSSYRTVSYSRAPPVSKSPPVKSAAAASLKEESGSSRLIPRWVQLLVFLLVALFLYMVFSNMESTVSDPFKQLG